ncbi:hypothetical protein FRC11_007693, partial [Ceratobasidium sp. 423]
MSDGLKDLKLVEGNYPIWSRHVEDALSIHRLSCFINPNFPCPNLADLIACSIWQQHDGLVQEAIVNTLDTSQYLYVEDSLLALRVWSILWEIHTLMTEGCAHLIQSQMMALKMAEGSSFEEHLAKLKCLFTEMSTLGEPIAEGEQKHALLASLLPSWGHIMLGMESFPRPLVETVKGLCNVTRSLAEGTVGSPSVPGAAGTAFSAQPSDSDKICCWECTNTGHCMGAANCPDVIKCIAAFRTDWANQRHRNG